MTWWKLVGAIVTALALFEPVRHLIAYRVAIMNVRRNQMAYQKMVEAGQAANDARAEKPRTTLVRP